VMKIPPYPDQGKTLRDAFVAQIGQDFPPDRSAQIAAAVGSMDEMFVGFGKYAQTYTVTQSPEDQDTFQMVFTAALPDNGATPNTETAGEPPRLTGTSDRSAILIYWAAIGPQVSAHFPPKPQPAAPAAQSGTP
jgi:hypothetical protein